MDILLTRVKKLISNCAYYQSEKYDKVRSFEEFPIIDRYELVKSYQSFVCNTKPIIYTKTSGSSGIPLRIPWNYNDYLKSLACLWRLRAKYGIFPTTFQLTCHCGIDTLGKIVDNPVVVFPNMLSLSKLFYSEDILKEYLRKIELFKPKWIYAQPSFVYFIGKYITYNKPELLSGIIYIELVGELLTPDVKTQIQVMFPNAHVVNMYGMQEFNGIMYEEKGIMKVIHDNVYVELVDEFGNDPGIDKEGDIVVTGLYNSTFPLIRYNTKDRGKRVILDGVEGYQLTVGRSNDQFIWNDVTYDGSLFFSVLNEYSKRNDRNVIQFQVIYADDCFTVLIFSLNSNIEEYKIEKELENIIIDLIGVCLPLKVLVVPSMSDFIKNENKIKYFINNNIGGKK